MKSTVLTLLISFLVASVSVAQNQIIVDKNINGIGEYSDLNDAINAASDNDVILVIPAPSSYGNITLTKSNITIAGGGANGQSGEYTLLGTVTLSATLQSGLQNITLGGFRSGNITVTGGVNKIKDLNIQGVYVDGNVSISAVDTLKLGFVRTGNISISGSTEVVLYHNEITGAFTVSTTQNFIVSNSLISGSGLTVDDESKGLFNNNNFASNYDGGNWTLNFGTTVNVTNNIFRYVPGPGYAIVFQGGAVFQYNMVSHHYGPTYINFNPNFGTMTANTAQNENQYNNFIAPNAGGDATTYTNKGTGVNDDGTTANIGYTGGLNPIPSELPSVAKGVSVVPSITNLQLSLPNPASGGSVILNVTGKSKRN